LVEVLLGERAVLADRERVAGEGAARQPVLRVLREHLLGLAGRLDQPVVLEVVLKEYERQFGRVRVGLPAVEHRLVPRGGRVGGVGGEDAVEGGAGAVEVGLAGRLRVLGPRGADLAGDVPLLLVRPVVVPAAGQPGEEDDDQPDLEYARLVREPPPGAAERGGQPPQPPRSRGLRTVGRRSGLAFSAAHSVRVRVGSHQLTPPHPQPTTHNQVPPE
jgi:hypothetical protein